MKKLFVAVALVMGLGTSVAFANNSILTLTVFLSSPLCNPLQQVFFDKIAL